MRVNRAYVPLYGLTCRYIALYGGRRSSKSWSTSQLLVRKACEYKRRIVVLRKFATTIRNSVWDRIQGALQESLGLERCKINKSERHITLPTGSEFIFVGADDPEKLKSIEMVTDYWLEEATEFTEMDFNVLDAGLSVPCDPPPQMWFTFNPIPIITGYEHWLQKRFLSIEHELGTIRTMGEITVFKSWYKNNSFCPQKNIDVLEGYKQDYPDLYEMWAKGNWIHLKGAILVRNEKPTWDVVDNVPPEVQLLGYGLDWGFAEDPAAVVKVWKRRRELWVEEVLYGTGMTNPQLSQAMEAVGMRKAIDSIIADCAEPKSIQELKELGWIVQASEKGQDYKREAALFLRGYDIHAIGGSEHLTKELATWSWKQDKEGTVLPLVADGNDHTIDALIYRTFRERGVLALDTAAQAKAEGIPYMKQSVVTGSVAAVAL